MAETDGQPSQDAYANCRFYVTIDKDPVAVFTEVSGLQVQMDVTEYEEGGNNEFVHRLPGRTRVSNLTLKRGMTRSNAFYQWQAEVAQGHITRRNVSVVMYDAAGEKLVQWDFVNAYPVKWVGPQLVSDGTATSIETL